MGNVIDKELLSHLVKLEADQQEKVLIYIKEILTTAEMQKRADASMADIEAGRVKSFSQFSEDFENWKKQRRTNTK